MASVAASSLPKFKIVFYAPLPALSACKSAIFSAGAGRYPGPGNYTECCWTVVGEGQFRPGVGANPNIGTVGDLEKVEEARCETVVWGRERVGGVVEALKK